VQVQPKILEVLELESQETVSAVACADDADDIIQETVAPKKSNFKKWFLGIPIAVGVSFLPFLLRDTPVPTQVSESLSAIFGLWVMIMVPWAMCRKIKRDWFT
jgi:hypothetical protein